MDRDSIVRICNKIQLGSVDIGDITMLLHEYCMYKKVDASKIPHFINFIINNPMFNECINIALTHYKKEFNIIELRKNNNILLIY